MRAIVALAVAAGLGAWPAGAGASGFTPPTLDGHISDPGNQLSRDDRLRLDHSLEDFRLRSGFALVALVLNSLDGESIEDVAYRAFNTWKIGEAGKDNGVLIVISTGDHKVRIETGKGTGGSLTDLQASDIIRHQMAPLLKQGRLADAIDAGSQAIEAVLRGDPAAAPGRPIAAGSSLSTWILLGLLVVFFPITLLLWIFSQRFREWVKRSFNNPRGGGGYGGGGYGGGGFGGGGYGGGGDAGSGYSGGGGSSGGGGASDSY